MQRVLLINMPWSAVYRPAIGISLMKAHLARAGIGSEIRYLNLSWASDLFEQVLGDTAGMEVRDVIRWFPPKVLDLLFQNSLNCSMVDEWLFSRELFGAECPDPDGYVQTILKQEYCAEEASLSLSLRVLVRPFLQRCLDAIPWKKYTMVGFTSTFRQNLASFALARLVKERFPDLPIIMGGANCEGKMGKAMIRRFPFIDYVATGEADESFPALLQRLDEGRSPEGIKGIVWRRDGEPVLHPEPALVKDMDRLPSPDYDDYFAQVRALPFAHLLQIRVPLEQSRGCWWGMRSHCTFCGLNGQTMDFRAKSPQRAWDEVFEIKDKYGPSHVDFTDNILHWPYLKTLMPRLAGIDHGLSFFYEVKSNLKKRQVELLRTAGVTRLQPGIESLSTEVLKLMGKGCTALQNVQCLKWCFQYGIAADWNLLYGFPSEPPEEYSTMRSLLEGITHLPPPNVLCRIRLDRFSPNFERSDAAGIVKVRPQKPYRYLYPFPEEDLSDLVYFFAYDYADGRDPDSYIQHLKEFIDTWKAQKHRGTLIHVRLGDGGALIDDTRFNRVEPFFLLNAYENSVYTFCDEIRTLEQVRAAVPAHEAESVESLLKLFVDQRIMVREKDKYLSVAPVATSEGAGKVDRAGQYLAVLG